MSEPFPKLTAAHLAALLCARICHDLISPVGALSAALEVFDDDDNLDMRDDAMELIKLSAAQASAKLQFLRLAFGAGGSASGVIASSELERLAIGVYGQGRVQLDWKLDRDGLDKTASRVLLNLIMMAHMSIPRGGKMFVKSTHSPQQVDIKITCEGLKARLDGEVTKTLSGGAPEDGFDGRSIQPFYTGMIARENGGSVFSTIEGEIVTFSASFPLNDS
ncbi:MAG: hypothetical protein JKX72_11030 [Robiginitomaculum sp.]|nr:hypothetical protein [Robiginitomaculum sp.]